MVVPRAGGSGGGERADAADAADADDGDDGGDVKAAKAELRERVQADLARMSDDQRDEEGRAVVRHLRELEVFRGAVELMVYVSLPTEVPTRALIAERLEAGLAVCVPRVAGWGIDPVPIESLDQLEPGTFGIPEPPGRPEDPRVLELVVVPGLAFDPRGGRLGRGTGHIDRFLNASDPPAVGLAFRCQVVDRVPMEEHDHPVDVLVHPDGVAGPRAEAALGEEA